MLFKLNYAHNIIVDTRSLSINTALQCSCGCCCLLDKCVAVIFPPFYLFVFFPLAVWCVCVCACPRLLVCVMCVLLCFNYPGSYTLLNYYLNYYSSCIVLFSVSCDPQ